MEGQREVKVCLCVGTELKLPSVDGDKQPPCFGRQVMNTDPFRSWETKQSVQVGLIDDLISHLLCVSLFTNRPQKSAWLRKSVFL